MIWGPPVGFRTGPNQQRTHQAGGPLQSWIHHPKTGGLEKSYLRPVLAKRTHLSLEGQEGPAPSVLG